jgi:type II secretory pathway pseudopilin PulG
MRARDLGVGRRGVWRGILLIEALVAITIVVTAFLVLLSVFATSGRQATLTRNRLLAMIEAENTMELAAGHEFGTPPPAFWTHDHTTVCVVDGLSWTSELHEDIAYQTHGFDGRDPNAETDDLTITVGWREGTGPNGQALEKHLQVITKAWRNR